MHIRRRRPRCQYRGPRSQRLVGILAGGDGLGVADGDLAVQIRNVGDGLDLGVGALSANDHKVVDEHILTGVGVDEPGGLGVVHGALGSGDEHVDRGAGTHLLDEVAGALNCVSANVVPVCSV